jgi:hypothetical protein
VADPLPIVEPKEALQFFRQKGLTPSFAWQDVWQEEHVRSFTVAKAMSRDILEDIRGEVDKAIANGTTLEDFRRDLRPLLERKGWWGRKAMTDPQTGERKIVQLGSPRRLKTIFEVNMRSAYSAGRWERIQRVKKGFPYLRYRHSDSVKVAREEHLAWDGVIKPVDDPWWETHHGPNGWGCKCDAVPTSGSMLDRRGWEVTDDPPSFPKVNYTNPRTGEVTPIERGIDPGFSFNAGKAYLDSLAPRPIAPAGGAAPAAAVDAFLDSFGVDPKKSAGHVVFDRAGWPIAVSRAWFRTIGGKAAMPGKLSKAAAERELAHVGRAIVAPDEIRQVWIGGEDGKADAGPPLPRDDRGPGNRRRYRPRRVEVRNGPGRHRARAVPRRPARLVERRPGIRPALHRLGRRPGAARDAGNAAGAGQRAPARAPGRARRSQAAEERGPGREQDPPCAAHPRRRSPPRPGAHGRGPGEGGPDLQRGQAQPRRAVQGGLGLPGAYRFDGGRRALRRRVRDPAQSRRGPDALSEVIAAQACARGPSQTSGTARSLRAHIRAQAPTFNAAGRSSPFQSRNNLR